ncbi:MAG: Maf family protein [Eggerthellaceae bacterium]|nr:Maf family protein [Eggerthellaceae bacterium]
MINEQRAKEAGEQANAPTAPALHIVLASKSPRRKELLEQAGVHFIVHASEADETLDEALQNDPAAAAGVLAERKAGAVVQELLAQKPLEAWVVIGADTMVVLDGEVFGKPRNLSQAKHMLRALSGATHEVMTGVSVWLVNGDADGKVSVGKKTFTDISKVTFHELSDEQIDEYLKMGESFDKAGAYAVQGHAASFVSGIEGAVDTVIGLPVGRLLEEFPDLLRA